MNIKLIIMDVDGVLTDGKLHLSSNGDELKSFHTQDGMGISLARYAGIKSAIITGRTSEAVNRRAKELKIDYVYQGIKDKTQILNEIIAFENVEKENICYIGDDINDLPILKQVGYAASPSNAVPLVLKNVDFVAERPGGEGAVRSIIDNILEQQAEYSNLIRNFINVEDFVQ
ncbi:KdsC family phosphatase [Paraliobacillus ryukyuensis]|uniref:KdsC family phosphatase n=1 Tax=Paraliobacillus ryukyuensis TaxID=200904 RepID=UPI0009A6987F|nr:HAD family hydrolase [Paraliobacillus ryukyuensis]